MTPIDAIVPGSALTLGLCAELRRLAPFGLGNPGVNLLVAGCELTDLATVGEGKHLRFRVRDRGRPAGSAIAFGLGSQLDRFRRIGHYDLAFRLQENTWNGTTRRSSSSGGSSRRPTAISSCATGSSPSGGPDG